MNHLFHCCGEDLGLLEVDFNEITPHEIML